MIVGGGLRIETTTPLSHIERSLHNVSQVALGVSYQREQRLLAIGICDPQSTGFEAGAPIGSLEFNSPQYPLDDAHVVVVNNAAHIRKAKVATVGGLGARLVAHNRAAGKLIKANEVTVCGLSTTYAEMIDTAEQNEKQEAHRKGRSGSSSQPMIRFPEPALYPAFATHYLVFDTAVSLTERMFFYLKTAALTRVGLNGVELHTTVDGKSAIRESILRRILSNECVEVDASCTATFRLEAAASRRAGAGIKGLGACTNAVVPSTGSTMEPSTVATIRSSCYCLPFAEKDVGRFTNNLEEGFDTLETAVTQGMQHMAMLQSDLPGDSFPPFLKPLLFQPLKGRAETLSDRDIVDAIVFPHGLALQDNTTTDLAELRYISNPRHPAFKQYGLFSRHARGIRMIVALIRRDGSVSLEEGPITLPAPFIPANQMISPYAGLIQFPSILPCSQTYTMSFNPTGETPAVKVAGLRRRNSGGDGDEDEMDESVRRAISDARAKQANGASEDEAANVVVGGEIDGTFRERYRAQRHRRLVRIGALRRRVVSSLHSRGLEMNTAILKVPVEKTIEIETADGEVIPFKWMPDEARALRLLSRLVSRVREAQRRHELRIQGAFLRWEEDWDCMVQSSSDGCSSGLEEDCGTPVQRGAFNSKPKVEEDWEPYQRHAEALDELENEALTGETLEINAENLGSYGRFANDPRGVHLYGKIPTRTSEESRLNNDAALDAALDLPIPVPSQANLVAVPTVSSLGECFISMRTKRRIQPGEELLLHYGKAHLLASSPWTVTSGFGSLDDMEHELARLLLPDDADIGLWDLPTRTALLSQVQPGMARGDISTAEDGVAPGSLALNRHRQKPIEPAPLPLLPPPVVRGVEGTWDATCDAQFKAVEKMAAGGGPLEVGGPLSLLPEGPIRGGVYLAWKCTLCESWTTNAPLPSTNCDPVQLMTQGFGDYESHSACVAYPIVHPRSLSLPTGIRYCSCCRAPETPNAPMLLIVYVRPEEAGSQCSPKPGNEFGFSEELSQLIDAAAGQLICQDLPLGDQLERVQMLHPQVQAAPTSSCDVWGTIVGPISIPGAPFPLELPYVPWQLWHPSISLRTALMYGRPFGDLQYMMGSGGFMSILGNLSPNAVFAVDWGTMPTPDLLLCVCRYTAQLLGANPRELIDAVCRDMPTVRKCLSSAATRTRLSVVSSTEELVSLVRWLRGAPDGPVSKDVLPLSGECSVAIPIVGDTLTNPKSCTFTQQTTSFAIPGHAISEGGPPAKVMCAQGFAPQRGINLREVEEQVLQEVIPKGRQPSPSGKLMPPSSKLSKPTNELAAELMKKLRARHSSEATGVLKTEMGSEEKDTVRHSSGTRMQRYVTVRRAGVFTNRSYIRGEEVCVIGGITKVIPHSDAEARRSCARCFQSEGGSPHALGHCSPQMPVRSYADLPSTSYFYYSLPSIFPNPRFEWKLPHLCGGNGRDDVADMHVFSGDSLDFLKHGLQMAVTPTNESQYILLCGEPTASAHPPPHRPNVRLKLCWESSGCAYVALFATRDLVFGEEIIASYDDVLLSSASVPE